MERATKRQQFLHPKKLTWHGEKSIALVSSRTPGSHLHSNKSHMFDGDPSTFWAGEATVTPKVVVDFGAIVNIFNVDLGCREDDYGKDKGYCGSDRYSEVSVSVSTQAAQFVGTSLVPKTKLGPTQAGEHNKLSMIFYGPHGGIAGDHVVIEWKCAKGRRS